MGTHRNHLLLLALLLLAPGLSLGGTWTKKTTKDGKTTVTTNDPKLAERLKKRQEVEAQRLKDIAAAPKREAADPVVVALFQTTVSADLQKATQGRLFPAFRAEMAKQPPLQLMDQPQVDAYNADFKTGEPKRLGASPDELDLLPADIYVVTFAKMEEKVGIHKKTKKLAKAPYLFYEGEVHSEFNDKVLKVQAEGHILQNVQVTKEFSDKLAAAILQQAGPGIPKEAGKFRRMAYYIGSNPDPKAREMQDTLRKLFKK